MDALNDVLYLDVAWERSEDIVNLILETTRQHLVGLVKNEDLDIARVDDLEFKFELRSVALIG